MSSSSSLFKTKLCHLFLRGNCHRQTCSFAHGDAELRRSSSSSNNASLGLLNGRREFRGDLRERLQRRQSPRSKRFSPGRDSRGRQDRGRSYSRSPARGRSNRSASPPDSGPNKRGKKRLRHDERRSENSEDPRNSAVSIDRSPQNALESLSPDPFEELEEELHEVHAEIESLKVHLLDYESAVEEKTKDINDLSKMNLEMDLKLHKEHEDYKRLHSKLKKFIKLYLRCTRAQEEVKKTQGRLHKLVDDMPSSDVPRVKDDSDVNIVRDGDSNLIHGTYTVTTVEDSDLEEGLPSRGKVKVTMKSCMAENKSCNADSDTCRGKHYSRIEEDMVAAKSHADDMTNKVRNWDLNASLPSTGLAAHAEDDALENYSDDQNGILDVLPKGNNGSSSGTIAEQVKLNGVQVSMAELSQVPLSSFNQYAQYAGDDEDVDVD